MARLEITYLPGQTPLDPDEKAGLKPKHISTQGELHKRMLGNTWTWAGTYRKSDKNIGCDWRQVAVRVRNLLEDTKYQIKHTVTEPDELAIRFHHRLVLIHPFPNGNGRHSRLITDLLLQKIGIKPFSWGSGGYAALLAFARK